MNDRTPIPVSVSSPTPLTRRNSHLDTSASSPFRSPKPSQPRQSSPEAVASAYKSCPQFPTFIQLALLFPSLHTRSPQRTKTYHINQRLKRSLPPLPNQLRSIMTLPTLPILAKIPSKRLLPPRTPTRVRNRRKSRDTLVQPRVFKV